MVFLQQGTIPSDIHTSPVPSVARAGAAVSTAIDAPVAAFWKSSFRPMRMAVEDVAVAGRTDETRGAGTTNPRTAVRHTTSNPRNFMFVRVVVLFVLM